MNLNPGPMGPSGPNALPGGIPAKAGAKPKAPKDEFVFRPVLGLGLFLNGLAFAASVALMVGSFMFFSRLTPGPLFFISFLLALSFSVPVMFFGYRLYSLMSGTYTLTRNSLRLRWGLRSEVIPLTDVHWIRTPAALNRDVPWPLLPMPGGYVGKVTLSDGDTVEFMASDVKNMLFIGTAEMIFGVSPRLPSLFITAYERMLQLGILTEAERLTIRPADWFVLSFKNRTARISTVLSLAMLVFLSLWLGFRLSHDDMVQFGVTADGVLRDPVPVGNAMILPLLSGLFWLMNLFVGVRLYREESLRWMSEIVWSSSVLVSALFLLAGFFVM